jgi:outer membrane receptor protein involved in Fe transport
MNSKLSSAIAAILGSVSFGATVLASPAEGPDTAAAPSASSDSLQEITVTAQRRSESMQDVPISMQAFTGQTLQQLNIQTFDDYIKYLPNVTSANNGPGQNEVFMRGLSAGSQASQGSGSTGLWPNVAIYLDNQSAQLPNRNLDIYAADLNRIEVLEGPQGTLFGAGAEAGVIRYITNEPKLDVTEGNVTAGYGVTAHGDPNNNVTAVLNLPLIDGTFAVRGVIYEDHRGGYIDNVPGTFTRQNTDLGIAKYGYGDYPAGCGPNSTPAGPPCQVPPGSPSLNNAALVGNAINPADYSGTRVEALYKFNEDWNVLLTQSYQNLNTQGVFYQQPNASDGGSLQPLEVTLFNPAYDKDRFESTAWTVNGKIGDIKAVYTGGFLDRHVDQQGDYTNYARGNYADYYQCVGPAQGVKSVCYSPSATWHSSTVRPSRIHPYRHFIYSGRIESHDFTRGGREHLEGAVRDSRLLHRQRLDRRRQGCLVGERIRREPRQFEREHLHQHRSIHRRADAASAAGSGRLVRLQILSAGGYSSAGQRSHMTSLD